MAVSGADSFDAGEVEHADAIRPQAVEANDAAGAAGQVFARGLVIFLPAGENEHRERELRLVELDPLPFPIVGECFVKPLQERAGPLRVHARGVVADDVMGRRVGAEAGRQFGENKLSERAAGVSGLKASSVVAVLQFRRARSSTGRRRWFGAGCRRRLLR